MNAPATPLEIFRAKGIPHRRMEDWKYTDLRQVIAVDDIEKSYGAVIAIATPTGVESLAGRDEDMPEWVTARRNLLASTSAMDSAARSPGANKAALRVPSDIAVEMPIGLEFSAGGQAEITLLLERGASATLREVHHACAEDLRNISLTIFLEDRAQLTHVREAKAADGQVVVETVSVVQDENSRYIARFLNGGAKLSRTEVNITLQGEGAEADLSGVSVLGDGAHADITTRIEHATPNTTSRQLFKKVAGGKSRAVYQGKITVREGAVGSDSRQTAKALLLGNHAEADLKPELEILADDVKCAHGAAVGDLDQDSLFYLRSRGIPEEEARALLIHAFLEEVIDGIADDALRAEAVKFVDEGLARAMEDRP